VRPPPGSPPAEKERLEHGVGGQCVTEAAVVTVDGQQVRSHPALKGIDHVGLPVSGCGNDQTPVELPAKRGRGDEYFPGGGGRLGHARSDRFSERCRDAGGCEHLLDEERDAL
jgi:hypothetical protein